MPENKNSTRSLVSKQFRLDPLKNSVIISRIMKLFEERANGDDYSAINTELRALAYIKTLALKIAQESYPLVCDASGEPKYTIICDPYTLALKLELTIDPNSKHPLAGRKVQLNLMHRSANNNFAPPDIERIFESKVETARSFFPNNEAFQRKISSFAGDLQQTQTNKNEATDSLTFAEKVKIICGKYSQFVKATNDKDTKTTDRYIKSIIEVNDELLTRLAIEIVRQQKRAPTYNPTKAQIKAAKLEIKQREIELISKRQRPVIMHAYFQDTDKPKTIQALVNTIDPLTDISSDLRIFQDDQLSNYAKVTNHCLQFTETSNVNQPFKLTKDIVDSFYRSASIAELIDPLADDETNATTAEHSNQDDEDMGRVRAESRISAEELVARELAVLKKIMIRVAKQQLIERLLAGGDDPMAIELIVSSGATAKLAFTTLLTPILNREHAKSWTSYGAHNIPGFANTLLRGNELEQLMSMLLTFSNIEGTQLQFSAQDMRDVTAALHSKPRVIDKLNRCKPLRVIPKVSFANLAVNQDPLFGRPGESLDFTQFNPAYNAEGMVKMIRNIEDYIDEKYEKNNKPGNIHIALRNLFAQTLKVDKITWQHFQQDFLNRAANFDPEMQKIVFHFLRVNTHIKGLSVSKSNSRNADAYLVATADLYVLNRMLGFDVHVTCKSGKDRTGLFSLLREALIDADNNDRLIDNICNALKHSSAKTMNEFNVPGGRGLQVDEDILDGLKELFGENFEGQERIKAIFQEQQTRRVSGIPRKVYTSKTATDEWLKKNKPTEPEISGSKRLLINAQASFKSVAPSASLLSNPFIKRDRDLGLFDNMPKLPTFATKKSPTAAAKTTAPVNTPAVQLPPPKKPTAAPPITVKPTPKPGTPATPRAPVTPSTPTPTPTPTPSTEAETPALAPQDPLLAELKSLLAKRDQKNRNSHS